MTFIGVILLDETKYLRLGHSVKSIQFFENITSVAIYFSIMAGRKPTISKELQVECYKNYKDELFIDNKLVPFNNPIFDTIAKKLKVSKECAYLAINRYIKEINVSALFRKRTYQHDSEEEYSPFQFDTSFQIKSKSVYIIDISEKNIFEIKSRKLVGEWSRKLNDELWKTLKMPCCWTFKYGKYITNLNEVKLEGSCEE